MSVCVCECVCAIPLRVSLDLVHLNTVGLVAGVCIYVYVCTCTYVCVYVSVCVCVYVSVCVCHTPACQS